MKKLVFIMTVLALLLPTTALAQGRSFAFGMDGKTDLYGWDGTMLTEAGAYLDMYSITDENLPPDQELFAAGIESEESAAVPDVEYGEEGTYPARKYAVMDAVGALKTDFLYNSIEYDSKNDVLICYVDGKVGALSRTLEALVPCAYQAVAADGEGGFLLAVESDVDAPVLISVSKDGTQRETGVHANFYWQNASDGLLLAYDAEGRTGYLTFQGQWAIEPRLDWGDVFKNGYASVQAADKVGVIDSSGAWVLGPYESEISIGLAEDGSVALVSGGGVVKLLALPSGAEIFAEKISDDGYATVGSSIPCIFISNGGRSTLVDFSGKEILSLAGRYFFDVWGSPSMDALIASTPGKSELVNPSGEVLYACKSINYMDTVDGRNLYETVNYRSLQQNDGESETYEIPIDRTYRYGLIDAEGREVFPMIYTQLHSIIPGRFYAEDALYRGVIDLDGHWIVRVSQYSELVD